ncbi:MAG: LodA/GoxA family CTQ-dependent oxidase [Polaribacter sp.]|uniref:LodA/GoxA family CTQ-dependent oxidase n=1 Tax=Polaribacter sp. TaxID=1920175 RepID=UPI00326390DD
MSLDTITYIKVYPGIGTARVGNSPEYFIGPEFPGDVPNLGGNYKDNNGFLKPQAARFRVYGFDTNNNVVTEITHDPDNGVTLEWDVHMRNLKAANYAFQGKFGFNPDQYRNPGVSPNASGTDPDSRSSLIIDPGAKTITGISQNNDSAVQLDGGTIFSGITNPVNIPTSLYKKGEPGMTEVMYNEKEVSLGRLETDNSGRLIVVGGKGEAGCLIEPPIILQKGAGYLAKLLGEAKAASPSTGTFPNTFYNNTIEIDLSTKPYPEKILLSSNNDATGNVFVDDKCIIKINGTEVFSHDFSNGGSGVITPTEPIDITNQIKPYFGERFSVTIEYVDLHPNSKGASDFWFCYTNEDPTSNGNSYFNNPGWYDDTSGGSINANVNINGVSFSTNNKEERRGWVAVSPPKYVPTMNNVVSLLDLQLDMFPEQDPVSGTVNFALLNTNGFPNFSPGSSSISFKPLTGVSKTGKGKPSIVNYNGNIYLAYTGISSENLLAVSKDNGNTWTESRIGSNTTSYAPSLCVFNGELTYVFVDTNGFLSIGTSTDGENFTFEGANSGPVGPVLANSAPSAVAYNGDLYIAFATAENNITIAHRFLVPSNTIYEYSFTSFNNKVYASSNPVLGVFFGELYCAYTDANNNSFIGSYNNYSPAPSPAVIKFNFNQIKGAPTTKFSPGIGASHGKLFYAIVNESSDFYLGMAKPGFTDVSFVNKGIVQTKSAPVVANFSDIEFYRDIYPILKTVTDYAWVNEPAFQGHAPGSMGDFLRDGSIAGYSNPNLTNNPYRKFVFKAIRPAEQLTPLVPPPPAAIPNPTNKTVDGVKPSIPNGGVQSGRLMPHLFGEGGSPLENNFNDTNFPNQWLSLTPHQLWKIQEWVNGNFKTGAIPVLPASFNDISLSEQPAALNFSALEPTVGGGFHPGIELTYNMKEPGYFAEAFRFADSITSNGNIVQGITPGSVAGYMSIPWQGDFWSCNISWWAAMRPDIVVSMDTSLDPPKLEYEPWFRGEAVGIPKNADSISDYEGGYEHMVRYWSYFGFVVPQKDKETGSFETDQGMFVMEESERAPCLDKGGSGAPCVPVNPAEPIHLGVAQPNSASTGPFPDTFYTNSIDVILPSEGTITLSSLKDGTGNIVVDDKCVIKINDTVVFSKDYSNGGSGVITPTAPIDITSLVNSFRGTIVTISIEYIDLYPGAKRGSDYWITYS